MPVVFTPLMVVYQSISILIKPTACRIWRRCIKYSKCSTSSLQEEFVNESSRLIDSALTQYEKTMHTAARLILDYELYFLDRIYKHSINK